MSKLTRRPPDPIPTEEDLAAVTTGFARALVRVIRANDRFGILDQRTDFSLLNAYVLTPERLRALPVIGDPDARQKNKIDMYYSGIGLAIDGETGQMGQPLVRLHSEGWGRAMVVVGRLVVLDQTVREVHRFGFPSLSKLVEKGTAQVAAAVELIRQYPEVAHLYSD